MNSPPPLPGPPPQPARDPRARDVVPDFAGMDAVVGGLGTVTSAALGAARAATMVRAVFDAVSPLPHPPRAGDLAAVDRNGARTEDRLAELWEEHRRAPFPDSFRGVQVAGVELILLDAEVAGLVHRELGDGLDDGGIAVLWACITDLDKVLPLIGSAYCASYFARLRTMAGLVAARHLPTAT